MTTEKVKELTEDQITAFDLQDRLRAMSFDVMPATIVCGMAGISEGAYRARLKRGQLGVRYIHFGLRMIQVVPVDEVLREFFPDGLDEEAEEEFMFGLVNDSLIISKEGNVFRVLFAGFTEISAVKRAAMAHAYKHGKNDGTVHRRAK